MSIYVGYPAALFLGIPLVLTCAYWRWYYHKKPVYRYSSVTPLRFSKNTQDHATQVLFFLRLLTLIALCAALARFRIPDEHSRLPVQGIAIMLVLDVSESMYFVDDKDDPRTRIEVALDEAGKFIEKRENDPIGLVLFGNVAVSRTPLTLDKRLLKEILKETTIGVIDSHGTVLSRAILTAANRLKNTTAKSKIMIVLTDGQPMGNDSDPQLSIDVAKKLGIKIYTIGIGSDRPRVIHHPFHGLVQLNSELNIPLLKAFAQETGGQFFQARKSQDMEAIYTTIDQLESSEHQAPLFGRYFEYFTLFLWVALIALPSELILTTCIWRSL